jgi:hypothetical protein
MDAKTEEIDLWGDRDEVRLTLKSPPNSPFLEIASEVPSIKLNYN